MDFNDTKDEAQFREEVSTWLSNNAEKKQHASTCRHIFETVITPCIQQSESGTYIHSWRLWT